MNTSILQNAIKEAGGLTAVAAATGKSYQAVQKWVKSGLPRTEWTGETKYSEVIASMQSAYSVDDLLNSRAPH